MTAGTLLSMGRALPRRPWQVSPLGLPDGTDMWYFTWILGLGLALAFGIINVMWLEASYFSGELDEDRVRKRFQRGGRPID